MVAWTWRSRALGAALTLACAAAAAEEGDGWKTLFDGKTLEGWRTTGAVWKVEDGAIVGSAAADLKSGYCLTKERYADYEIELDFKIDWPFDSGLFMRTTDEGKAYQVTIDHRPGGYIGAIYVGGLPGGREKAYLATPKGQKEYPAELPKDSKVIKQGEWNHLAARIEGKAPHIVVKLNDEQIVDVTDKEERHQADGPIGLQVHGNRTEETSCFVRYKNIRVRPIVRQAQAPPAAPATISIAVSGMT